MNYAIILAGGTGTRFWPLSRQQKPKQFLRIYSNKAMIEETTRRVTRLVDRNNIYIATNKIYYKKFRSYSKKLHIPPKNLFFEPQVKNTLAPIGLLTKRIFKQDKKAVIVVLPSDHYIKYESRFLSILRQGICVARDGYIVTLGIKPDRPETGYGYIKVKSKKQKVYDVDKFIEKPPLPKAKRLIKDKSYYWNSGIFIFKAKTLLEEIKKLVPRQYGIMVKINNSQDLNRLWSKFNSISIDCAVMEKTRKIALIPADFGWNDLGSWQSMEFLAKKDKNGNIFKGNCIDIGSKNIFAWSSDRILATLGLDNIIIVDTKDALLVCAKERTQDIKKIVQMLNCANKKTNLNNK
jgi:mannose-1-phosphate guanylyltransferase/mannose-6-phosphate isomerase